MIKLAGLSVRTGCGGCGSTPRHVGVVLLLLLFPVTINPEPVYHITKSMVLPPKFYVGDLVELRVNIESETNITFEIPTVLPESKWIKVEDVTFTSLSNGKLEVRILLRSFQPGTHVLPPIGLGDIVLHDLKIHTNSILEETDTEKLRPLRNQTMLPYTWLRLSGILVIIIMAPFLFYRIISRVHSRIFTLRAERLKKIPFQRVKRALGKLEKNIGREEERRGFFIGIS